MPTPSMMYGTAWKEDATTSLTTSAILSGFRAIDTANQAKHYQELLVGEALLQAADQGITREQLYLQTKYTSVDGQDHRLPYDPKAPYEEQVEQSLTSSLAHLHTDVLDSFLLHGPSTRAGLTDADWQVWRGIEAALERGQTRAIGVSNVNADQLSLFLTHARHKPTIVQNRCYANRKWDGAVRAICRQHGMIFQGFSLLTANPQVMKDPTLGSIADAHGATKAQVIYRYSQQVGMLPLTGTTNETHMQEALSCEAFTLSAKEVAWIEAAG